MVATLLVLIGLIFLQPMVLLLARTPLPRSAAVLVDRAQTQLQKLGFAIEAQNSAHGLDVHEAFLNRLASDPSPARWSRLDAKRTAAIDFWYRQGQEPLVAWGLTGRVTWDDPPLRPGIVQLRLDPTGRLRQLLAPSRHAGGDRLPDPGDARPEFDWRLLFEAADLDIEKFRAVIPRRVPRAFADRRAAWVGHYPGSLRDRIRIEAASFDGLPTEFKILEAGMPGEMASRTSSGNVRYDQGLMLLLVLVAAAMAWRTLRSGRGDRAGALRLGGGVFVIGFLVTLLTGNHAQDLRLEGQLLLRGLAQGLLSGAQFVLFYFALEPHVRRFWPETLSSWSRLLQGRVRDALVGRSLLAGQLAGAMTATLVLLAFYSSSWVSLEQCPPFVDPMLSGKEAQTLLGPRFHMGSFLDLLILSTGFGMLFLLGLVLTRLLVRNRSLAMLLFGLVTTCSWTLLAPPSVWQNYWSWLLFAGVAAICVFVTVRIGLLALVVTVATYTLLTWFPLSLDMADWKSGSTLFALSAMALTTVYGVTASLRLR